MFLILEVGLFFSVNSYICSNVSWSINWRRLCIAVKSTNVAATTRGSCCCCRCCCCCSQDYKLRLNGNNFQAGKIALKCKWKSNWKMFVFALASAKRIFNMLANNLATWLSWDCTAILAKSILHYDCECS